MSANTNQPQAQRMSSGHEAKEKASVGAPDAAPDAACTHAEAGRHAHVSTACTVVLPCSGAGAGTRAGIGAGAGRGWPRVVEVTEQFA